MSSERRRYQQSIPSRRSRRRALRFEALEPRLPLDGQGVLAGVDPHLTLSFANDGVPIAGQVNSLSAAFDAVVPSSVWREQILRAFQTWAIHTNADIGLVSDGGQAFGAPGARQGDNRFGDIRVGAIVTSTEVGAVSVPITNLISGTWVADVLFNVHFGYQSADDILAVATHEAGNVFGLPDSADPNSPLFTGGPPAVKLPTESDIGALQALHGVRAPDLNESHRNDNGTFGDNDSLLHSTQLALVDSPNSVAGSAPTIIYGDIGAASDADYFSLTTPDEYAGAVTFELRSAGISLLQPEITIFDAAAQPIAQASSQIVGGDRLTVRLASTTPHQQLSIRVAGADTGVFGIGGYSLVVQFDGLNEVAQATIDSIAGGAFRYFTQENLAKFFDPEGNEFFNDDGHGDDTAARGTELETVAGFAEGTHYSVIGSIADGSDVDYYVVKSPPANGSPTTTLSVSIRSLDAAGLTPEVVLLDEDLQPVAGEIILNGSGELVAQVGAIEPHTDYVVGVRAAHPAGPFATGNYELVAVFGGPTADLQSMAQGTVGGGTNGNRHTLYVGRAQLFHLVLETSAAAAPSTAAVAISIRDENSNVVATFASPPGQRLSPPTVFLEPGTYTVDAVALTLDGSLPPELHYDLLGQSISDPFVGDPADPNSHPFACDDPNLAGYFCYPGDIHSPDPFLWDDFIASLPEPPPPLSLTELIDLLIGNWWSWVWAQIGDNGPPLAQDDIFVTTRVSASGVSLSEILGPGANVMVNDFDPEGDPKVAVLVSPTMHGDLSLSSDGTFTYLPSAGFIGTDRFTYVVNDFTQSSNTATVRLVVGSGIVGDYDASGLIDDNDLIAWRASFGSVDELLADGNRDGVVDTADYVVWRSQLDAVMGSGVTALASGYATNDVTDSPPVDAVLRTDPVGPPSDLGLQFQATPGSGIVAAVALSPPQTAATVFRATAAPPARERIATPSLLLSIAESEARCPAASCESRPVRWRDSATDAAFEGWPRKIQVRLRETTLLVSQVVGRWMQ